MLLANLVSERTALQRDRHRLHLAQGKKARLQRQLAALQREDDLAKVSTNQLAAELCMFEKDCEMLRDAAAHAQYPLENAHTSSSSHGQIAWSCDLQGWMDEMETITNTMKKAFTDRVQARAREAASNSR